MPLDFEFHLGHVERVFPAEGELVWYSGNRRKTDKAVSQFILIKPSSGLLPSLRNKIYARPLLRGVSDSITRGDLVLWAEVSDKFFYLGPLNTENSPNYSPDHTYRPPKKNKGTRKDGYSVMFPIELRPTKLKKQSSILDRFGPDLEEYSELDLLSKFTDMTFEGRHGNSIRLGSRREYPQIIISNKRRGQSESTLDGSGISMFSVGSLMQNLYGYGEIDKIFLPLSCDNDDIENPREIHINYGNDTIPAGQGEIENYFDYDYGDPLITNNDEQIYGENKSNQMILFSDRIIFDAQRWDLTFSAHRNINLGAGKNFTLTNKGFSVIESNNIYLGREAKRRAQPMVLGEELRKVLVQIMEILRDSRALVQGIPIPLVKQDSSPMAIEIEKVLQNLNTEYSANLQEGTEFETNPRPIGDRSVGGPSFFSNHHFIESNRPKPRRQ